jgi:hypothetical protein
MHHKDKKLKFSMYRKPTQTNVIISIALAIHMSINYQVLTTY